MLRQGARSVGGVQTVFLQAGPTESDEAVVFVHGNPGFSQDWENLLERVGAFSRGVAPDMPGFGDSGKPKSFDYTVGGYAQRLGALLPKLGVRRAHLVLHDFGGPWGLAWALADPGALTSLTLINTGVLPNYSWHYLARIWRAPILGEMFMAGATRPGFHLLLKHGNPRGLPRPFLDAMFDRFDSGTKSAILRLYRATGDPGEMAEKFGDAFRSWNCPTLVIWGAADPYIPVRYAELQRDFFRNAQIHVLRDSGHWPYADDPDGVAAIALPFLSSAMRGAIAEAPTSPAASEVRPDRR
jgi:pimeloyl-ACP methyl ester carboxylesterase